MHKKILVLLLSSFFTLSLYSQENTVNTEPLNDGSDKAKIVHLAFDCDFLQPSFGIASDFHFPMKDFWFIYGNLAFLPYSSKFEWSSWYIYPNLALGAGLNHCFKNSRQTNIYALAGMGVSLQMFNPNYGTKDSNGKTNDAIFDGPLMFRVATGIDLPALRGVNFFIQYNFDFFLYKTSYTHRHSISFGRALGDFSTVDKRPKTKKTRQPNEAYEDIYGAPYDSPATGEDITELEDFTDFNFDD